MTGLKPITKVAIILAIVASMFGYAVYERNKFWANPQKSDDLILASLPSFQFDTLAGNGEKIESKSLLQEQRGLIVHFWGTWCAPCEAEFPELVKLATSYADKSVKSLLIAVNDDQEKVKRFLKRFQLPSNIVVGLDAQGTSMTLFGTVKVPETYLFNANGIHINKYVGPQDWENPTYPDQIDRLLSKTP